MILRKRMKSSVVMRIGLASLAIANLARWGVRRTGVLGEDATDGWIGFLFGIAIGTLLLALWMNRQGRLDGK